MELTDDTGHLSGQVACVHGHGGRLDCLIILCVGTNINEDPANSMFAFFTRRTFCAIVKCVPEGRRRVFDGRGS